VDRPIKAKPRLCAGDTGNELADRRFLAFASDAHRTSSIRLGVATRYPH
jgi:hypothetical protein